MTHVRQILLTSLLVLTAVSVVFLVGCDGQNRLSFGGSYRSGGSYPHSTSYYRPTQVYSPSRTVYTSGGSLYYPGTISRTHIRSYPRIYRPLTTHRGSRYSGHRSTYTGHGGGYSGGHSSGRSSGYSGGYSSGRSSGRSSGSHSSGGSRSGGGSRGHR